MKALNPFAPRLGSLMEDYAIDLDRVVKKDKDFQKFAGKAVKVRLKIAENGQRKFSGILKGLQDGKVSVQVGETLKAFDQKNLDEVRLDDAAAVDFGGEE